MRVREIITTFRRVRPQQVVIVSALALYWLSLVLFPRVWTRWPLRSHYYYRNLGLLWPLGWSALPLLLTVAALLLLSWRRRRLGLATMSLLFLSAVALQWSYSFLGDLSARRLSSTLVSVRFGHSEFLKIAAQREPPLAWARQYEDRCAAAAPRSYMRTKPPGQLLFYALTASAYRLLPAEGLCSSVARRMGFEPREPLTALGAFTTIVFSLASCLAVLVMALLGARLDRPEKGLYYGLVFLLCPSTLLITMHLDQVLYPACVACTLLATVLAVEKHAAFGVLAGALLYASVYVSFSLLFLLPTVALWWAAYSLKPESRPRALAATAWLALGLAVSYGVWRWGLGFALVHALQRAMELHAAWRGEAGLVGARGTVRNLVEAAFWLGIPAAVLCGAQWLHCAGQVLRRQATALDLFLLLYPLIVLAVSTVGHATREIGRLWLPMLIPAQIAAARELSRISPQRPTAYVLLASLAVLLRKNYHDFC